MARYLGGVRFWGVALLSLGPSGGLPPSAVNWEQPSYISSVNSQTIAAVYWGEQVWTREEYACRLALLVSTVKEEV